MTMNDLQSLYEKMRTHLLAMPGPAWDDAVGGCYYRTPDGNACLVGCLLTDEDAREADRTLDEATVLALRHFPNVPYVAAFFDRAQWIHDTDAKAVVSGGDCAVEIWRARALSRLDALARETDLEVPV
jgi:hypothetical protein